LQLRGAGIAAFNIDLVYGLPRQTLETLSRTLDQALSLAPDRFAVFGYAHVPWMKPHQKLIAADQLPAGPLRAAMAALVSERLAGAGYVPVGLDHYAQPRDRLARAAASGRLRRNPGLRRTMAAWVVGIGASAICACPPAIRRTSRTRRSTWRPSPKAGLPPPAALPSAPTTGCAPTSSAT
jgi:oxygen-independent coproporphyrinogen-3 oxidase